MIWWCLIFLITGVQLVRCDIDLDVESENGEDAEEFLPGIYPTFRQIPKTAFSCLGKLNWNYYADLETDCQVFHICETQYSKLSFLCPIGSVFNQRHLVCDWWYNVECQNSVGLYPENNNLVDGEPLFFEEADLSLASSGGNVDPNESEEKQPESKKKEKSTKNRN
ncbi:unnamed protein product [Ceutorhynchus assimilis]|uniref:Chitin-binding type-2 domain-containing protein n=1 Tax=Ceutorhynchus assimilis TaxID=467358 RepID=A0A9N9MUN0_9CUCU|nr:unnamed protein product [Ceutorhynchus assimilis]